MKKRFICILLLLAAIFNILPGAHSRVNALSDTDSMYILRKLPYDKQVTGPEIIYKNLQDKHSVIIFGRTTCPNTMRAVPDLLQVVQDEKLEDKLNLLYFDVDQSKSSIEAKAALWNNPNLATFMGGKEQMFDLIEDVSVNFPAMVYVGKFGITRFTTTDSVGPLTIKKNIQKLLEPAPLEPEEPLPTISDFKVLADNGQSVEQRKNEIFAYSRSVMDLYVDAKEKFSAEPVYLKAPYSEGALSQAYIDYATKSLNFSRFLAGLPDDITTTPELDALSQKGALLLAASEYSHTPKKPAKMSDELYKQAYKSTSESNIAIGYANLNTTLNLGWMYDGDSDNISAVGHRLWALNPQMLYTGFGEVNRNYTMYAIDHSRKDPVDFDAIAYPSGSAFPVEYFSAEYPWSVSLNMEKFEVPKLADVQVTLTGGGQTYKFAYKNLSANAEYFNVTKDTGGLGNVIVFRPTVKNLSGEYTVTITGLKTRSGNPAVLTYSTFFFSLKEMDTTPKPEKPKITVTRQPSPDTLVVETDIKGSISIEATVNLGKTIEYQWEESTPGAEKGRPIAGATGPVFDIPTTLKEGVYRYTCVMSVDGQELLRSNVARVSVGPAEAAGLVKGINILALPSKTTYYVGEGFDTSGCKIVLNSTLSVTDVTDKLKYFTSKTVELTQGRPFQTEGKKVVEIKQLGGQKIAEYTINVVKKPDILPDKSEDTKTPEETPGAKHPFKDVQAGVYYEQAVIWALDNKVTSGTSESTFAPNEVCTRGQVVTFLWRAQGSPEPANVKNVFTDVKEKDYFYKAVQWAVQKGITSGTSATTFSPTAMCTSGQVVTFLWRANNKPAATKPSVLAAAYAGQYYTDAVAWADSIGLLSGTGTTFSPLQNSPRADIVTYLYRNAHHPNSNTSASLP